MSKLEVLVVGATGTQGGAVAMALLRAGHRVRAMTRNLAHPAADVLRMRGARLAWSDLEDERAVREAMKGVDAVFAVTTARVAGTEAETRQGLRLVELATSAGVGHFVYSSAVGSVALTGVPHFDSKHEVERFLQAAPVPHTIVSPTFLMDNLLGDPWVGRLRDGSLSLPLAPNRKLQQLALADLAAFVRLVLEQPERFAGRRLTIAADALTPIEMAATLARVAGRPVQHAIPVREAFRARNPAAAAMFEWLDRNQGVADVAALRREFPQVNWHTLDGWARRQDWGQLDAHRTG